MKCLDTEFEGKIGFFFVETVFPLYILVWWTWMKNLGLLSKVGNFQKNLIEITFSVNFQTARGFALTNTVPK